LIFDDKQAFMHQFVQSHASIASVLCLITVLYTISFIQLAYEKFTYKVA